MKEKTPYLRGVLRVLSSLSLFALLYAVWAVVTASALKKGDLGLEWPLTGLSVAAGAAGLLFGWIFGLVRIRAWIRDVTLWVLTAAAGAVCGYASWRWFPDVLIGGWIVAGLMAFGLFRLGIYFSKKQPGIYWVLIGGGLQLFCFFILRMTDGGRDFPAAGFVWTFFAVAFFVTAGANYENINGHMTRRGHSMARLPHAIRGNNLILVILLFAAAAMLLLLRRPLGEALRTVLRWIIFAVLWLFSAIASLFSGNTGGAGGGYGQADTGTAAGEGGDDRWMFVQWIVLGLIILFFVIIGAKPFARFVREKFLALIAAIRRWLRKMLGGRMRRTENADYVDVIETVETGAPDERKRSPKSAARLWRRKVALAKRMKPGRDRMCADWQLLEEGISLAGADRRTGDTPLETADRASAILRGTRVVPVASEVERLVFSARGGRTDPAELEEILGQLEKTL